MLCFFFIVPASIITPDRFPVLVPVGSDVSLPCTAVGYPKPSISWQSNVNGFNRGKRWMAEDKPKLLYRITKEMEGEYTCTASNQYGKDENVVILTVQGIANMIVFLFVNDRISMWRFSMLKFKFKNCVELYKNNIRFHNCPSSLLFYFLSFNVLLIIYLFIP